MSQASKEQTEIELIDDTQAEKIMTNTISQAYRLTKGDEGEEIVENGKEKCQEREKEEKRHGGCRSMRRNGEISIEELIKSESE